MLTRSPAAMLDQTTVVGSLRQGCAGDFVVFTGDPLDLGSALLATWIDGVRVYGEAPPARPSTPTTAEPAGAR